MRYVIVVAYDGTNYCGWQSQKNGMAVQDRLEDALFSAFGKRATIIASGRTDSGVHAAGQVCHFDAELTIPAEKIADALNAKLPPDVCVIKSVEAPEGFHANRSVENKTYRYGMYIARREHPLKSRYAVAVFPCPDIEKMRFCARLFEGEHDFKAYCASGSSVKTTKRRIYSVIVTKGFSLGSTDIFIDVCGEGFLYNMVRTVAGTLYASGLGKISPENIKRSLSEGDRGLVGKTMPAKGLTLESVKYGIELFPAE